ncbi:spore germination protein PC [Peribacillus deserti]|uniref:Spore germination protein PC n=1 Tax=Peribacillus deserti TaxID=673318 RepID=A0ABS2QLL2_9BACI|nr:spore germination protein GerPC [Peribacillus deserti]MBM7694002.1 spore germination protein PC [Peribacillus deserti]
MNADYHTYFCQLQSYLEFQDKRIKDLEAAVHTLSTELRQLKEKPAVNVERIEYRFDQLKVERLDGTLNIGLNPQELQNIDEFAVNSEPVHIPYVFPQRDQVIEHICRTLQTYMNTELAENLARAGADSPSIDPSYLNFIKEDISSQLPQKIIYYLDSVPVNERTPEELSVQIENITEKLKVDLSQAFFTFLNSAPKQQ